jgi:hypothetical protein
LFTPELKARNRPSGERNLGNPASVEEKSFSAPSSIELSEMNAEVKDQNTVTVSWKTISETNNYGFNLSRTSNTNHTEFLSFVKGYGTTLQLQSYVYIDGPLQAGSYSYQIKQVDLDGTTKEYDPISVVVTSAASVVPSWLKANASKVIIGLLFLFLIAGYLIFR